MKKAALILTCSSITAFAGLSDRVEKLEHEMTEVGATTTMDTFGASFAPGAPNVDGRGFFIVGELLYWHAKVGGTDYAYSLSSAVNFNALNFPVKGATKENDFSWHLGAKAALGYNLPHNNWDLLVRYTYFESNDTDSSAKYFPSAIRMMRTFSNFAIFAERAKSHFDIDYNNLDLELGRWTYMSPQIAVRPHVGVKAAWIDLQQKITYGLPQSPLDALSGTDNKVKDNSDFKGVGPRIGIDSNWHLGYGFSIKADASFSVLYGHYKVRHKEDFPEGIVFAQIETFDIKMKSKTHAFSPFLNTILGLQWESYLNDSKQHLSLSAGYEVQYYWRQNQMEFSEDFHTAAAVNPPFRLQFEKRSEDVMFYGLNFQARLDF